VFLSQHRKLTAPVLLRDTITAEAVVPSVHPSKPVMQLGATVRQQDGEVVLEGKAWCLTMRPVND
jgi:acyl dehydratase